MIVLISSQHVHSRFTSHQIQIQERDPLMENKQILVSQEKTLQDYKNLNLPFGFDLEPTIKTKKPKSENTLEPRQSKTQKSSFFQILKNMKKLLKKDKKFERLMKMAMQLESDMEGYVRLH